MNNFRKFLFVGASLLATPTAFGQSADCRVLSYQNLDAVECKGLPSDSGLAAPDGSNDSRIGLSPGRAPIDMLKPGTAIGGSSTTPAITGSTTSTTTISTPVTTTTGSTTSTTTISTPVTPTTGSTTSTTTISTPVATTTGSTTGTTTTSTTVPATIPVSTSPIGSPTGVPLAPLVATNPVEDIIVSKLRKEDAKASYLGAVTREGAIQSDKGFARDQRDQQQGDIHTDSSTWSPTKTAGL